jgi:hypothetical protein
MRKIATEKTAGPIDSEMESGKRLMQGLQKNGTTTRQMMDMLCETLKDDPAIVAAIRKNPSARSQLIAAYLWPRG